MLAAEYRDKGLAMPVDTIAVVHAWLAEPGAFIGPNDIYANDAHFIRENSP